MKTGCGLSIFNGNLASGVHQETIEKMMFPWRSHEKKENQVMERVPVDILETSKDYVFYVDVPGLSKTDIQVTLEEENTLVIKSSSGKRKREDGEDEGCKYTRLERKASPKFMRKFCLPQDCNVNKVSAKCENGVLSVTVEKLPPPPKSKTVEVTIS